MTLPVFPDFKGLELDDRTAIESFTLRFEPYSDLNFTSLWCWNTDDEVAWSVLDHNLIVRLPSYGADGPSRYSLLGDHNVAATIRRVLSDGSITDRMTLVPEMVAQELIGDDDLVVVEDRDNADYVIDIAQFLARAGQRYEQVRRDINRFVGRSSTRVIDLDLHDAETHEFVDQVSQQWLANHSDVSELIASDLECESMAISRSMRLGADLRGIGLLLDGEPYSFSLFELVGSEWSVGHFAKTAWPLRGATLFQLDATLSHSFAGGCRFFNEEQDLGVPGLRTAKQRHRPSRLLRKYTVVLGKPSCVGPRVSNRPAAAMS